jgi:PAS domain S-box-containing protein
LKRVIIRLGLVSNAQPLEKIRILLIDDEETQIELIMINLGKLDPRFEITSVAKPANVLKLLKKSDFECLVSDYSLPGMSGIQLCAEIRKTSKVPFILYTARGSEEVAAEAFSAGVNSYLKKEPELSHYLLLANRIREIVEKWRTEQQLHESEQRLRFHIEHSPVAVIEWDSNFIVTFWSGGAEKIFGWGSAETVGKPIADLKITYEDDTRIVEETMKKLTDGVSTRVVSSNRNLTKTGRVIHCTWYNSVLIDERGKMMSVMSLVLDNTSTIEIEEKLRKTNLDLNHSKKQLQNYVNMLEERVVERTTEFKETKERLESFLESAPDAILIYDLGLKLLDLNKAALAIYPPGTTKEKLVGKRMVDIAPGIEKTARYKGFLRTLETGQVYHEEGYTILPSIGEGLVSTWAFRTGKNLGIIRRDVTQMEIDRRTALEAEKIASVTLMSQVVAHDLRGPLGAIIQAVNMTKWDPSIGERMLKVIEENAVKSLTLIAGWRSNTRAIIPQLVETDLLALIDKLLEGTAKPENIALKVTYGEKIKLRTDPDILRKALNNIVENALEAMPNGGELRASTDVEGDKVVIKIADTGLGIPDEAREKIFTPLYTTKPGGMGLGLTYSKRAVQALGGKIGFESKSGIGTTFIVELPLK